MTQISPEPGGGAPEAAIPDEIARPRRPLGVVVLVLLHLVLAGLGVAAATGIRDFSPGSGQAILLEKLGDLSFAFAFVAIGGVVIAIGLWRLDEWAWYGAMIWTGVGLAFQILLYLSGHQSYLYMVIYVIEAFYLNQREVKAIFQRATVGPAPVVLQDDRAADG